MATSPVHARQFRDVFPRVICHASSVNMPDAATGSGTFSSVDVTVPGAELGDFVLCNLAIDTVDVGVTAAVTAANVVTVTVLNNTAGAVNLAAATCRICVLKPSADAFFV